MVNILNEKLSGVPMSELHNKIFKEIVTVLRGYVHNYDSAIKILDGTFQVPLSEKDILWREGKYAFATRVS